MPFYRLCISQNGDHGRHIKNFIGSAYAYDVTVFEKDKSESKTESTEFRTENMIRTNLMYSHEEPTGFDVVKCCKGSSTAECFHNMIGPSFSAVGTDRGLLQGTIQLCTWRDLANHKKLQNFQRFNRMLQYTCLQRHRWTKPI
jgi:hypothetical protein